MSDVLKTISTRKTPQSQPAGGATTLNSAGGYVFAVDDMTRLRRFLVLGSEGGTYYTSAPELTRDNAAVILRVAATDPRALVDTIVEISTAGRAPRQNPAIFALAIAASVPEKPEDRRFALDALPAVCRTATHLYLFLGYVKQFRGWGPALKRAVADWYLNKPVDKLAYQAVKYRSRDGWTHRDALRLAKPTTSDASRDALFGWITGKSVEDGMLPALVSAYEYVQTASVKEVVGLIGTHDLSWEMLPDKMLNEASVWEALIVKGMPQTALMRQLPRLTRLGLADGEVGRRIATQLADTELLKRGRVHPINVLVAQRTYASGRSVRGDSTWEPNRKIIDALDAAFYNAYGAVEPSGKRILLACDVSGSMGSPASGLPITCREATAALALVSLNVEQDCEVIGFSDGQGLAARSRWMYTTGNTQASATRLDISPRRRLDDVCRYMAELNFGRTDCALPMLWAARNKLDFQSIVCLTDNETWWGTIHPHQALKQYREHVGHDVKYTVVSMTATGSSVADPADPSSMDIAGFDSNVPQVISSFSAGLI